MNENPYQTPAPDDSATPFAASASGYQSLQRRTQVLKVTLAIDIGALGIMAMIFAGFAIGRGYTETNFAVGALFALAGFTLVIVRVVNFVLVLSYIRRTNINARALGAAGMRFSPVGSIGWWFVPLANLYQPFAIVKELVLSSEPGKPGFQWRDQSSPWIVAAWWLLWLGGGLVNYLSRRLGVAFAEPTGELTLLSLASAMSAIAGVLLINIITSISEKQAAKASQHLAQLKTELTTAKSAFADS